MASDDPEKTQEQAWLSMGEVLARLGISRETLIQRTEPENGTAFYYRTKVVPVAHGGLELLILESDLKRRSSDEIQSDEVHSA